MKDEEVQSVLSSVAPAAVASSLDDMNVYALVQVRQKYDIHKYSMTIIYIYICRQVI